MIKIMIYTLPVLITYIIANIYWHKKIVDCKWEYTIFSTIILLTYFAITVLINLSLA